MSNNGFGDIYRKVIERQQRARDLIQNMCKSKICAKLMVKNEIGDSVQLTSKMFNNSVERYGQDPDQ